MRRQRRHPGRRQRSFTLIEAVVSIAIVAVMLVAGLGTLAASRRTQYLMDTRSRGQLLAQALMAEILRQHYEEPDDQPVFGLEGSESPFVRRLWDDVDDYHGWCACPPQDKDGKVMTDLTGWSRRVVVEWVNPADLTGGWSSDTGVKKVTVTVARGKDVLASMVALRTKAWSGEDRLKVLFVVTSSGNPTAQERARKSLMSLWGFAVTLIDASSPQSGLDNALAKNEVAYISEEVNPLVLGSKLRATSVGVVNEDPELLDEFGFAETGFLKDRDEVKILDNSHYITSIFLAGYLPIFSSPQPVCLLQPEYAAGLRVLGECFNVGSETNNKPGLAVLEPGSALYGGGAAAGRRVQLPWGGDSFDINALNENGKALMRRAIEWTAGREQPQ